MSANEDWAVHAGLDEAGYGPLLGPLTIGYSAFRTTGTDAAHWMCDWDRLAAAVSDDPKADARRLVVADSKKVFTRNPRGEARLERTALAFVRAAGHGVQSGFDLVTRAPSGLAPSQSTLDEHPWYGCLPKELPLKTAVDEQAGREAQLKEVLGSSKTEVADAGVVVIPSGALNRSFQETENKGATLWRFNSGVIAHLFDTFGAEGLDLTVDRLGGRARYGRMLNLLIPFSTVRVVSETRGDSRYEVHAGDRRMRVRFVQKGDSLSLPVALGSCLAKYARELTMGAFNAHFESLCAPRPAAKSTPTPGNAGEAPPTLKPTAGYVTDARRWLEQIESILPGTLQNRDVLIRTR